MNDPDPRVGGRERLGDVAGAVGASVVDDDDLEILQPELVERRDGGRHRAPEVLSLVVRRKEDAELANVLCVHAHASARN